MDTQTARRSSLLFFALSAPVALVLASSSMLLSACGIADASDANDANDADDESDANDALPEDDAALIDYERDVQPIWDAHCTSCHGDGPNAQAGLILRAGDSF